MLNIKTDPNSSATTWHVNPLGADISKLMKWGQNEVTRDGPIGGKWSSNDPD